MKKFVVVGFTSEIGQPVEIIPSKWLISEESCLWPSEEDTRNLNAMIKKGVSPNNTWHEVAIKIYGKSNSFSTANEKAEQARILSNIESDSSDDDLNEKRMTKPPIRYRNLPEGSEDDNSQSLLENNLISSTKSKRHTLPKHPTEKRNKIDKRKSGVSSGVKDFTLDKNASSSNVPPSQNLPEEEDSFINFLDETGSVPKEAVLEKILRYLREIKEEQRLVRKEFRELTNEIKGKKSQAKIDGNPEVAAAIEGIVSHEAFSNLPVSSVAELEALEKEISDDVYKATSLQVSR